MPDPPASISYRKLRQAIGWLGILLPILVVLVTNVFGDCGLLQDSISHYYYTIAGPVFVGVLWGLGLVLIFYPTYEHDPMADGWLTTLSGVCALLIAMVPTNALSHDSCALFGFKDVKLRTGIHYASAAVMLLIFSYMSYKIFTRTRPGNNLQGPENLWKRRRNRIYKVCGVITLLSVVAIGALSFWEKNTHHFPFSAKYTYWFEVTALVPFGLSWLIKGGFLFTDEGEESTAAMMGRRLLRSKR